VKIEEQCNRDDITVSPATFASSQRAVFGRRRHQSAPDASASRARRRSCGELRHDGEGERCRGVGAARRRESAAMS
jgi:hypothetical protein